MLAIIATLIYVKYFQNKEKHDKNKKNVEMTIDNSVIAVPANYNINNGEINVGLDEGIVTENVKSNDNIENNEDQDIIDQLDDIVTPGSIDHGHNDGIAIAVGSASEFEQNLGDNILGNDIMMDDIIQDMQTQR